MPFWFYRKINLEANVSIEQRTLTIDQRIKNLFKKVLDIAAEDIKPDAVLSESLGIDSTEMVEISVGLKKEFNVPIADNEIKKSHTFNEIIGILKAKGAN